MNRVYRLIWNRPVAFTALLSFSTAHATTFLEFNDGLSSWTTGGAVTLHNSTVTVPTGGATFTLTPAVGYDMARINAPNGGNVLSPNSTLGLSANSLESFLNNGNGHITNFGLMTKSFAFNVGTYTFAWAYGAQDYQPYNDGAVFSLVGNGSQSLISLARNGSNSSDTSGPSPDTLILGSYGATPWLTLSFDITTAGTYQLGFAVYNWNDQTLAPNLYLSGIAGTYTGTPVQLSGGTIPPAAPPIIGGTGGNLSDSIFDPSSSAYSGTTLTFDGGTLKYTGDTTTAKDTTLESGGGAIDTNGSSVNFTGVISGTGDLTKTGTGTLVLTSANAYTGKTIISEGTLSISGTGGLGASSLIENDGTLDISGATTNLTLKALSGNGILEFGSTNLTLTQSNNTYSGTLQGTGSLKIDSGSLTLSGTNTLSGTIAVTNGGTLTVTNDKSLGNASIALADSTLNIQKTLTISKTVGIGANTIITTGDDAVVKIDAPIVSLGSGGCFEKNGKGTLVMAGASTIESSTCVQDGKLYANGVLTSNVTVQPAGTLRGTGTISGTTLVAGTLAPGNSPGVLQSTGPVTMLNGSVYQEDINGTGTAAGPGNYSRLIITGAGNQFTATGATLAPNLTHVTGSDTYVPYVPKIGDAFRIVSAEGGIVGTFASVTQPEGLAEATRMEVYYNVGGSNSIDLFVVPTSYSSYVVQHEGNANAQSSAVVIDTLMTEKSAGTATESQDALLYAVSAQSDATLPATTTALAGEVHGALIAVAPMANRWLADSISRQLSYSHDSKAVEGGRGVWVDFGANRSDWRSDAVASGFDSTRSQVAIGWDVVDRDAARVGVGFSHGKVDVAAISGSGSVTHDIGFVYGQFGMQRLVLDSVAAFGGSDWETDRRDPVAPLTSLSTDPSGHDAMVAVGVRLPLATTAVAFAPYARATWERLSRGGFTEDASSVAALSTNGYSANGTRLTAGVLAGSHVNDPLAAGFTYQVNLGVGRDAADLVDPTFGATLAGVGTTISAPDVGRTFAYGQINGTARVVGRLYSYFGVSGEARSGKSDDLGANVGVRMTF